jgi:hypothetical protein
VKGEDFLKIVQRSSHSNETSVIYNLCVARPVFLLLFLILKVFFLQSERINVTEYDLLAF